MTDMPTPKSKATVRIAETKAILASVAKTRNTNDPILTHSVQRALNLYRAKVAK